MKFFNTAGPVNCEDHYCLPPLERFDLEELLQLIDQKKYFVLHAPRQTGKTSCLLALMKKLNEEGKYKCLYFNMEKAQSAREDVKRGMRTIIGEIALRAKIFLKDDFPSDNRKEMLELSGEDGALNEMLTHWSAQSEKPLVLFIDEIDSLIGDTLISVLRQLRSGYDTRPGHFPQSIILCGIRDVRDYRIHSDREKKIITGGSAFNVKAESLRMGDFSREETEILYQEHTKETGQTFAEGTLDAVWELSEGQPWLVNALAYEVCFKTKELREHSANITPEMIHQAGENLILRRETHIDQLADKLKEKRVQRVIGPILSGMENPEDISSDDVMYVTDLGLIKKDKKLRIANQLYKEVIPRELTFSTQLTISQETEWYVSKSGTLDMEKLMSAFQDFFREHSEHWVDRFQYKEAGPQLLLQAFLQRIVNSGGRVRREYGLGTKRTDLMLLWFYDDKIQKIVIELKILYKSLKKTVDEGLEQTWGYMDKCGTKEGHLVIFDRGKKSWDKKIFKKTETFKNTEIIVWGM
ncbi:AAA-like domain-containing protein [Desulfobacterales bacterium HSG17]|nr:AAA-like domain-containing protein [Desulfobacterales bacterium HSG17]